MALREVGARLTIDGEAEFKKQLGTAQREVSNLNSELKASQAEFNGQANSAEALRKKLELLRQKQEQQREITEKLAQAVEDASEAYGENDRRTDALRRQYNNARATLAKLNDEIDDNEKYLGEAEKAADGCATSIDGYGKKVKKAAEQTKPAAENSSLLDSALGKINVSGLTAAAVFGKIAGVLKNGIERMSQMVDETNDLRTSLAMLEVSAQNAGAAVDGDMRDSLIALKAVTGDWDSSAETLTNLYAAGITGGERLEEMLAYLSGAAIKFNDTLKTESLADSLQESLAVGNATGQFSELLERCGVDIDQFNERLGDSATYAERLDVAYDTLADTGIKDVADAYYEANDALIEYNKAQSRLELAKTDLASLFVPIKAAWTDAKAYMTEGLTDLMLHGLGGDTILRTLAKNAGTTFDEMEAYLRTNQMSWVEWNQAVKDSGMEADEYWAKLQAGAAELAAFEAAQNAANASLAETGVSVEAALTALEELQAEYDALYNSVDSNVSGFKNMDTEMANYSVSAQDIIAALQSQTEYLRNYKENWQMLIDAGLSYELAEQLADGSAQSAAYLQALADEVETSGTSVIESVNAEYGEVQQLKTELVDTYAAALPEMQERLEAITGEITGAVDDWNQYSEAYLSGQDTMQGFTDGLNSGAGALLTRMQYLGSLVSGNIGRYTGSVDGSHAAGLNYVPYDNYIAELHRGEQVLTASQAAAYRAGNGGRSVVVNVNAPSLNQSQVDYLIARVNRELGGAV